MSDWTNEDELNELFGDEGNQNSTMKVIRTKMKTDALKMKALEQQIATLTQSRTEEVVSGVLKSAGINPGVAKFYTGDADPTAVQAWVSENAALFGANSNPVTNNQPENTPSPIAGVPQVQATEIRVPAVPPVDQVDYARMLSAGVDGQPPSNYNDVMGKLNSIGTQEELLSFLASQQ